jgi:ABC-2 type transport system permease protein
MGFGVGALVGLPGWSADLATEAAARIAAAAVLTIVLQPVTGLLASVGRGYIAGLAWAVLAIAVAQVLAVLGLGELFPWAVPALISGAAGPDGPGVGTASLLLVGVTGLAGLAGTIAWWRRADHTG